MSTAAGPPEPSSGELASPRWSRLFHQSDDSLFVLNARRRVLYVNPAWENWAGLKFGAVRGQPCRFSTVLAADHQNALLGLLAPTKEALTGKESHVRRRGMPMMSPWIDVYFFPCKKDGQVFAILGRIVPIGVPPVTKGVPLPEKIVQLRERAARDYRLELWESDVATTIRAVAQARLASQVTIPVLLIGPQGCGREWLARAIHRLSPRCDEFFACLDARILPPSLLADLLLQPTTRFNLGAILLRHPGHLRPEIQVRLAELLAEERVGPRLFVSAADDVETAQLAPQLSAHVGALTIRLPALRARRADWPKLLPTMLARAGAIANKGLLTLSADADRALRLHDWPGNFREVATTLRTAALRAAGERIELADLPFALRGEPPPQEPTLPLDELLPNAERRLIRLALEQSGHNKSKAAQLLGIWRPRLLRRMEQLGIADTEPPGEPADA